ncbi:MAG: chemotaxis protein CheA [Ferruginibacter sp.]|nr:chemotaxis protein CheA [Cytophagales bacterium]
MDHLKAVFVEEATDLIGELEKSLLALGQTINSPAIEQVFRVMHTLKGNSAMFGFDAMSECTHQLETVYDLVRTDRMDFSEAILDVTLASVDHLRHLLTDAGLADARLRANHVRLLDQIGALSQLSAPAEIPPEAHPSPVRTGYLVFRPHPAIMVNGSNLLFLLDELHALGDCRVNAHSRHIPPLEELSVETCYIHWDAYLATAASEASIREVFLFVEDVSDLEIHWVSEGNLLVNEQFVAHLEEQYLTGQEVNIKELQAYVNQLLAIIREKTLAQYPGAKEVDPRGQRETGAVSTIRVASDKLDDLMNLVSELLTTQARLNLIAADSAQSELVAVAENIEKISRQLSDSTFSICLVPLESMLTRFQRLVRDLSAELGKEVRFAAEGTDTELDKTLIESLTDPLLHIFRNSIDHGIENPEVRMAGGKPRQGTITLKASYAGNHVLIQIQDDGAGLDQEKIRAKAVSKGLVPAGAVLNEKEVCDLIFQPGFSTAEKVTGVSGRGVGMDVVRRKIADVRGEVSVTSQRYVGTTITLKLPLTISIIDGLLVRIADTHFVIPLAVVDKCYETNHALLTNTFSNLVVLDGQQVPFFYLRTEFDVPENGPAIEQMVVVRHEGRRIGLTVDAIVGEYQAVLKPLGRLYKHLSILSGATILGDGTVALVVDTGQLIRECSPPVLQMAR